MYRLSAKYKDIRMTDHPLKGKLGNLYLYRMLLFAFYFP